MSNLQSTFAPKFAYSHGRMGVLKLMLLEQTDLDRMLGASTAHDVEKILTEVKMTNVIDQGISEGSEILEAVGTWMRGQVEEMSPEEKRSVFHILWLENDCPTLAYVIKKHHNLLSDVSEEPISGMCSYNPDALKNLIETSRAGILPAHLVEFINYMKTRENISAQEVDTAVSFYVADLQLKLARTSESDLIVSYVSHNIDLKNIRTALRQTEENPDEVLPYLLEGGTISRKELAGDKKVIISALKRSNISIFLPNDLESLLSDPVEFEQAAAHIVTSDLAKMWNVPLSVEPLFAFAAITINQLKIVRTILIAKRSELSPQETKRMLPPFLTASNFAS